MRSRRYIFSLASTWKGYFLAIFRSEIWQKVWFSLFSRRKSRRFTLILEFVLNSTKETTFCHWNEHHLGHCVVNIYSPGNSNWPKQRKGMFAFHQEAIPWEWLALVSRHPRKALNLDCCRRFSGCKGFFEGKSS